jgi:hypothetical protein
MVRVLLVLKVYHEPLISGGLVFGDQVSNKRDVYNGGGKSLQVYFVRIDEAERLFDVFFGKLS